MNQKHHGSNAISAQIASERQNIFCGLFARLHIEVKKGKRQSFKLLVNPLLLLIVEQPPVLTFVGAHTVNRHVARLGTDQACSPAPFKMRSHLGNRLSNVEHDSRHTRHDSAHGVQAVYLTLWNFWRDSHEANTR